MPKKVTWMLVADGERARLFEYKKGANPALDPVWDHQMVLPDRQSREIASDRPGRTFDSAGEGRHAKEIPTDPKRYEKQRFASEIVEKLDDARKRNEFEDLILVSPPQFLGDLRSAIKSPLDRCVTAEVSKDLSKLKPEEILEHFQNS